MDYLDIIKCIEKEFSDFERYIKQNITADADEFIPIVNNFFSRKGKRIRSALIFLFTKGLGREVDEKIFKLAFADEMIHNATLVHDDIIDGSAMRRDLKTIHTEYDSKLAVLTGDYLLSLALSALSSIENSEIFQIHSSSINKIINGEIGQYFQRNKLVPLEDYIKKSENKTAELFKAALCSTAVLNEKKVYYKQIEEFALYFGTAFQINNDLKDIEEDLLNGNYTAPVIFYAEGKNLKSFDTFPDIHELKTCGAIAKTKSLINTFMKKAQESVDFMQDSRYKNSIQELTFMMSGNEYLKD